jgi:SAM-dependent methyltransferase
MSELFDATTVLQRKTDLDLRLDATNSVRIPLPDGGQLECGPHGLSLLEAFAAPRAVGEVLAGHARTAQEWIHTSSALERLVRAGILVEPGRNGERTGTSTDYAFDWPFVHTKMLDDRVRTTAYQTAIRASVRPGDVVVDIGTGTGVLAATAARAGAERVYAVEAGAIADSAAALFAANGVGDRVQVLRGWSTRLDVPEPADLVVSEVIGKDPLDERVLEIVADARRRWLRPGGRMIPRRIEILGTPVSLPPDALQRYLFTGEAAQRWQGWYDLDFSALAERAPSPGTLYVRTATARDWPRLSEPLLLADLDLSGVCDTRVETEAVGTSCHDGTAHGVLLHFRLHLTDDVTLSTDPASADDTNSWRHALYLGPPRTVRAGDPIRIRYRYRCAGRPDGAELVGTPS